MNSFRLPRWRLAARRSPVRALFLLTMAFAVLLCGFDTSVLAHAFEAAPLEHSTVAEMPADHSDQDNGDSEPAKPDHAVHHHCHGEVAAGLPALECAPSERASTPYPAPLPELASRADAPLIEPPVA
jgi:hypothetical protein